MIGHYPNQKVSFKEKQSPEWYIPCADYLVSRAISINDKDTTAMNLNAANGIIDKSVYKYILEPLQVDTNVTKNLPGTIRDVDFLTPIKEKNIGEYIELPYEYVVTVANNDVMQLRNLALAQDLSKYVSQLYINEVNKAISTGIDSKEVPDLEEYSRTFIKNYVDERAIKGQERLHFLNELTDFDTRRIQSFYYWWATEEVYTHRYLENGEVRVVTINPMEGFPLDNGEQFVEDMDGFVWRRRITFTQFYDHYRHLIRKEDEDMLDVLYNRYKNNEPLTVPEQIFNTRLFGSLKTYYGDKEINDNFYQFASIDSSLWVNKIEWKTLKEIKHLTYINALGELVELEVDEDYKLDKANGDIKLWSEWINTTMTMYRFGDQGLAIYTEPIENPVQRRDPKNLSKCKLSFGGKKGLLDGININPIPKRILPHLALYRIYTLQLERTIAKYKGNIMTIPKSMLINDEAGTTSEKYFYMMADNTLIYDDSRINMQDVAQGFRVVGNQGLERYLQVLSQIIQGIKDEAWDLANMNKERYGDTSNSQTVGNAKQNIYSARIGSTLMISMFNKMLERDHQADLEYSKIAWVNGKEGSFWNPMEDTFKYITINGEEHAETEYGIFVKNSAVEREKLQQHKEMAFSAAQNGDFELASKAIDAKSVVQLSKYVDEHAVALREFQEQQQANEQNFNAQLEEAKQQENERIREHEMNMLIYKEEMANSREMLKANTSLYIDDNNLLNNQNDGGNNDLNNLKQQELELKRANSSIEQQIKVKALQLKEAEIKSKERIAKTNKNKYDVKSKSK